MFVLRFWIRRLILSQSLSHSFLEFGVQSPISWVWRMLIHSRHISEGIGASFVDTLSLGLNMRASL
jgi:hypothetical protein